MDRRLFLSCGPRDDVPAAVLAGCGGGSRRQDGKTDVRLGDTVAESNPEIAAERYFGERLAALTQNKYRSRSSRTARSVTPTG